ncbi:hypothetical protein QZM97_34615 [Burkholderia orbicola]|uniref:hypothetical protein n=1 Tax=Burkholderia cepacia complex TaxID=87882 RepID=UPI001F4494D8|nr:MULTISPECIES: hypothetical protein [Burkholderia cepacia complex]MDN7776496.1 hypothetical protein [Burkholderia orbicola]MDN7995235.1 hypothetical protein [Burkholderia orbicola]
MHDSYNDFCYRQRENCEGRDRRGGRPCAHACRLRGVTRTKRQSNQRDAMHAGTSVEAAGIHVDRERHPLRAACDIDMRKTSLERYDPDGYMPSLFSID